MIAFPALAVAQDQVWLKDRRYTEGPGFRFGDVELHPGAAAEFGFDSNYLHRAPELDQLMALRLRITPSFSVSTIGPQRREGGPPPTVQFRGGASATYNEFFPIGGNDPETIRKQRNVGVEADASLTLYPGRLVSGSLSASFMRVLTPTEDGRPPSNQINVFHRDVPRGAVEIAFAPGGGLFEWRLGYQFTGTFFEQSDFQRLDTFNHAVLTSGRWRFLPRTSLQYDAQLGFLSYPKGGSGPNAKLSSHPVRARLGINGLITPAFQLLLMVGWGSSFYTAPTVGDAGEQNFDSVIGQAELKWYFNPNTSADPNAMPRNLSAISVGFGRDFADSFLGASYYERDRGYLNFAYFFGGRFLTVVEGGVGPMIYPRLYVNADLLVDGFTDIRGDVSVFAEYRFKDWLGLNVTGRYAQNFDRLSIPVPSGDGGQTNVSLAFRQIEAYLGFRWLM